MSIFFLYLLSVENFADDSFDFFSDLENLKRGLAFYNYGKTSDGHHNHEVSFILHVKSISVDF